jgi:hypothetical protein
MCLAFIKILASVLPIMNIILRPLLIILDVWGQVQNCLKFLLGQFWELVATIKHIIWHPQQSAQKCLKFLKFLLGQFWELVAIIKHIIWHPQQSAQKCLKFLLGCFQKLLASMLQIFVWLATSIVSRAVHCLKSFIWQLWSVLSWSVTKFVWSPLLWLGKSLLPAFGCKEIWILRKAQQLLVLLYWLVEVPFLIVDLIRMTRPKVTQQASLWLSWVFATTTCIDLQRRMEMTRRQRDHNHHLGAKVSSHLKKEPRRKSKGSSKFMYFPILFLLTMPMVASMQPQAPIDSLLNDRPYSGRGIDSREEVKTMNLAINDY